jgi:hypothetical protein
MRASVQNNTFNVKTAKFKNDKAIVQNLSTFSPTFVDVRPLSTSQDETGLKDPFKITVKTFDGFTYILLVGKAGPEQIQIGSAWT